MVETVRFQKFHPVSTTALSEAMLYRKQSNEKVKKILLKTAQIIEKAYVYKIYFCSYAKNLLISVEEKLKYTASGKKIFSIQKIHLSS